MVVDCHESQSSHSHELASHAHQAAASSAHLALHIHLHSTLCRTADSILLVRIRVNVATRRLLVEQLACLRHGHANELVLRSTSTASTSSHRRASTSGEHLQCLHRGSAAHRLTAYSSSIRISAATTIHHLMLTNHILLVHVSALLSSTTAQHPERIAEETLVPRRPGMLLRMLHRAAVIIIAPTIRATSSISRASVAAYALTLPCASKPPSRHSLLVSLLHLLLDALVLALALTVPAAAVLAQLLPSRLVLAGALVRAAVRLVRVELLPRALLGVLTSALRWVRALLVVVVVGLSPLVAAVVAALVVVVVALVVRHDGICKR